MAENRIGNVCRSSKWNARFCNQFAHGAAFIGFRQINRLPSSRISQPSVWPHGLSPARETRSHEIFPPIESSGGCTLLRRAKCVHEAVWRVFSTYSPAKVSSFPSGCALVVMGISLIVFETAASALFLARFRRKACRIPLSARRSCALSGIVYNSLATECLLRGCGLGLSCSCCGAAGGCGSTACY